MYDVIYDIISHVWETGTSYNTTEQQTIYYICGCLIIILTVFFVDMVYRVFRHFWR